MKRALLAVVALCCQMSSTADDAVNVSRVAAWALQRREERIRRWLPSQPFNRTGFRLVPVPPKLERGFLLVATRVENHHAIDATSSSQLRLLDGVHDLTHWFISTQVATKSPVERLRRNESTNDNLGAILRDVCATPYPARLVVRTPSEKARAERFRPCPKIEIVALEATDAPMERLARATSLRLFKVGALAANLPLYKDGTLYLDNDIAIRRDRADVLMGLFDEVRKRHKALGVTKSQGAGQCIPRGHWTSEVPPGYCERNGGILFFSAANRSAALAREWLEEMREGTSKDGHDQMPLRKVLWRHRDDEVFDLPVGIQCRGPNCDPCSTKGHMHDDPPLLWHTKRVDRVRWAQKMLLKSRRKGVSARSVCGFQP